MAKCSECRMGRLSLDGSCRYCSRAKARVGPRRAPLDGVLRTFNFGTVAAITVLFGARAVLYTLGYSAVEDLRNGDLSAVDTLHTYSRWLTIDWFATVIGFVLLGRFQRRWTDAANANALTRRELGLAWFRTMPSSKTFLWWGWLQSLGYIAIVVVNLVFSKSVTSVDDLQDWAVLEVTLCLAVMISAVGGAVSAQRMTAQLLERIDSSEQAERAEKAAQAERAAQAELVARSPEPDPIV